MVKSTSGCFHEVISKTHKVIHKWNQRSNLILPLIISFQLSYWLPALDAKPTDAVLLQIHGHVHHCMWHLDVLCLCLCLCQGHHLVANTTQIQSSYLPGSWKLQPHQLSGASVDNAKLPGISSGTPHPSDCAVDVVVVTGVCVCVGGGRRDITRSQSRLIMQCCIIMACIWMIRHGGWIMSRIWIWKTSQCHRECQWLVLPAKISFFNTDQHNYWARQQTCFLL